MGVLKVWDGTDWRKVGCAGTSDLFADGTLYQFVFDLRPDQGAGLDSTTCSLHWYDGTTEHLVGTYTQPGAGAGFNWTTITADVSAYVTPGVTNEARLRYAGNPDTSHFREMHLLVDGSLASYGEFPLGYPYTAGIQDGEAGSPNYHELGEQGGGAAFQYDASNPGSMAFGLSFVRLYFPSPVTGRLRLRLPDGSWVREVCDDDPPDVYAASGWSWSGGTPTLPFTGTQAFTVLGPNVGSVQYTWITEDGETGSATPFSGSATITFGTSGKTTTHLEVFSNPAGTVYLEVSLPERHPLKIEDPANPGTWITVACFTPV